jgi:hypothetical protein
MPSQLAKGVNNAMLPNPDTVLNLLGLYFYLRDQINQSSRARSLFEPYAAKRKTKCQKLGRQLRDAHTADDWLVIVRLLGKMQNKAQATHTQSQQDSESAKSDGGIRSFVSGMADWTRNTISTLVVGYPNQKNIDDSFFAQILNATITYITNTLSLEEGADKQAYLDCIKANQEQITLADNRIKQGFVANNSIRKEIEQRYDLIWQGVFLRDPASLLTAVIEQLFNPYHYKAVNHDDIISDAYTKYQLNPTLPWMLQPTWFDIFYNGVLLPITELAQSEFIAHTLLPTGGEYLYKGQMTKPSKATPPLEMRAQDTTQAPLAEPRIHKLYTGNLLALFSPYYKDNSTGSKQPDIHEVETSHQAPSYPPCLSDEINIQAEQKSTYLPAHKSS